jgi:ribonuclease Y
MDTLTVIILAVLASLIGIGLGSFGFYVTWNKMSGGRFERARQQAESLVSDARREEGRVLQDARNEASKIVRTGQSQANEARDEIRERRREVQQAGQRLSNREDNLEKRGRNLDRREGELEQRDADTASIQAELSEAKQQQLKKLEVIAELSVSDAQAELMRQAEEEMQHEIALRYRDLEEEARSQADENAREIIGEAVQRLASDVISEATITNVSIPNDEMKGRLIGREGRNIRAIEKATGVDLIIDDTPENVTVSCFDPIRREVARLALTKLISDGRIHPARIEEVVAKTQKDLQEAIRKTGDSTVMDVGVRGLNKEMVTLVGRLKYRFSYGENVLMHSIEVGHLAATMAAELGANVRTAKMGGFLHDIGKALTHEVEGPHAVIGADVAARNKVPGPVCTAIAEHHDDDHSTVESFLVAAADALSAARPGARRDTVEHYIKRLEALEEVASSFEGVEKCYAIQAGREVRILVQPDDIDDLGANRMARDVVKKIEQDLTYPGQIKVTVIRESRSVDYAR